MAHTPDSKCAKNLCKRTVLLQLIIENVVMFFFVYVTNTRLQCVDPGEFVT